VKDTVIAEKDKDVLVGTSWSLLCCAVLCCRYDDVVTFLDPITKYSNVQGYMFNIRMLKGGEKALANTPTQPTSTSLSTQGADAYTLVT
jgi:hypothetical protein